MRCICGGRQYALLGLGFACALLLAFASGLMGWQSLRSVRETRALGDSLRARLDGRWVQLDSGDVVIRRKKGGP